MAKSDSRPDTTGYDNDCKDSGGRGTFANNGFAGKLREARRSLPDDVPNDEVANIAWAAFEANLDPATVWQRWRDGGDTDA